MQSRSPLTIATVPVLDRLARPLGAGVFWVAGGSAFWDAWRDAGGLTLRLGRLEVQVDRRQRTA